MKSNKSQHEVQNVRIIPATTVKECDIIALLCDLILAKSLSIKSLGIHSITMCTVIMKQR